MPKRRLALFLVPGLLLAGFGLWRLDPPFLARFAGEPAAPARQGSPVAGTAGAGPQRPPAPVELAQAESGRVADEVQALGTLSPNESVAVAPEVAGRIIAMPFREGQRVEEGALLVELDATIARAELTQARTNLQLAQDTVERNQTLVQRGAGTQVSLEQAAAQLATARAGVASAEARLEKLSIHAPFAGVMGLRSVSVGAIVQPGQTIATLTSLDPIKVDFGVPELFLSAVRVGQKLGIAVDAAPGRVFQGEVYAIAPIVDASGRAIRLRATVPNPEGALRPGLFARVTLTTGVREEAVTAPEAALIPSPTGQGFSAYVVREGRAALTPVQVGRRLEGRVEITEGLRAGDMVVVAGQQGLRDGAAVAIAAPRPAQGEPQRAAQDAGPGAAR